MFITGIITLFGGGIGYLTKGSVISLLMGLLFGIALLVCAYFTHKNRIPAQYMAMLLLGTLALVFAYRYLIAYRFMPAGLMLIVSVTGLILLLVNFKRKVH